MPDEAPPTTPDEAVSDPPRLPGAPVSRRALIGAGAGIAGLGALLGVGFLIKAEVSGMVVDERQRAAHLLRRAGFAPAASEVDAVVKNGIEVSTEALLHPEQSGDRGLESRLAADNFDLANVEQLRRWWLVRMAATSRPLSEKMTLFWHGLLTSSYRKAGKNHNLMYAQNQFLRQHSLGNLRDLLIGISKDGAMLKWLDGTGSSKAHPNENYARELMELFTMGVGNYAETDVRELARALTGWYIDATGKVAFRPRAHDTGSKTILGHTGNFGLEEAIDVILANPATPRHIATRMWEFFVYPQPSAADLQPVIDAYHRSHYDIREMMSAILGSPQFYSNRAFRALVKSPTELVAGVARQFGLTLDPNAFLAMATMGQSLFDPPDVAGWAGGAGWLSTGGWMARMRWLLAVSSQHAATGTAASGGAARPQDAVDHAVSLMLDGFISSGARQAITDHVQSIGAAAGPSDLFFLVAATPEYQLS